MKIVDQVAALRNDDFEVTVGAAAKVTLDEATGSGSGVCDDLPSNPGVVDVPVVVPVMHKVVSLQDQYGNPATYANGTTIPSQTRRMRQPVAVLIGPAIGLGGGGWPFIADTVAKRNSSEPETRRGTVSTRFFKVVVPSRLSTINVIAEVRSGNEFTYRMDRCNLEPGHWVHED